MPLTPEKISRLPYRPCVGVMLVNAEGHVFVGQRKDSDVPAWQMPQGGIDKVPLATRLALLAHLRQGDPPLPDLRVLDAQVTLEAAGHCAASRVSSCLKMYSSSGNRFFS